MQCSLQSHEVRDSQAFKAVTGLIDTEAATTSPCWSAAECDSNLVVIKPFSLCLNLEDLKCFEVVDHQFDQYGITFKNAIALMPSNPAYPSRSGKIVIMGAPKSGWLEATFFQPVNHFCCYVTSSQRTIMSAYDNQDKLIVRKSMTAANLADSDSPIPPNAQMKLEEPNISRITFHAFDGQLTIAELSFGL
ncbi:MAG: hypothetical protein U7123_24535 [Potamolinea sp.]